MTAALACLAVFAAGWLWLGVTIWRELRTDDVAPVIIDGPDVRGLPFRDACELAALRYPADIVAGAL